MIASQDFCWQNVLQADALHRKKDKFRDTLGVGLSVVDSGLVDQEKKMYTKQPYCGRCVGNICLN